MTITQLAQKHNLEPESAKAFLREWLDSQNPYTLRGKLGHHCSFYSTELRKGDVVIARPTDLGD